MNFITTRRWTCQTIYFLDLAVDDLHEVHRTDQTRNRCTDRNVRDANDKRYAALPRKSGTASIGPYRGRVVGRGGMRWPFLRVCHSISEPIATS